MTTYALIKQLKETKKPKPNIDYADFEVVVDGKTVAIGIPLREAEKFKAILAEKNSFNRRTFRGLMREFRGTTNRE